MIAKESNAMQRLKAGGKDSCASSLDPDISGRIRPQRITPPLLPPYSPEPNPADLQNTVDTPENQV